MDEEKIYRKSACPHCGATIETRSYDLDGGERVFGALPGRPTVHTTTYKVDGSFECREEPKAREELEVELAGGIKVTGLPHVCPTCAGEIEANEHPTAG